MDLQDLEHEPFFFETMSKRRKGFPSETKVKPGIRVVHGIPDCEQSKKTCITIHFLQPMGMIMCETVTILSPNQIKREFNARHHQGRSLHKQ